MWHEFEVFTTPEGKSFVRFNGDRASTGPFKTVADAQSYGRSIAAMRIERVQSPEVRAINEAVTDVWLSIKRFGRPDQYNFKGYV